MANKPEVFDSARITLQEGVSLVEASAGTGKTYAIAMLVLRAVTELAVPIEKILIVTFTKAATEELKSRIRMRLVDARKVLEGTLKDPDQTLADWADGVSDRNSALKQLQLALCDIDRAGIYTIHSFCQRMLQEQAMESGQLFDVELLADIDQIRNEVADDYWRTQVYHLKPLPCSILVASFSTPEKLHASVRQVGGGLGRLEPAMVPVEVVVARLEKNVQRLSDWWQHNNASLYEQYAATRDAKKFKKNLQVNLESWWQQLADFFSGTSAELPPDLQLLSRDGLLTELNGSKIRGREKQLQYVAGWPFPEEEVTELLQAVTDLVLAFRLGLAHQLPAEVSRRLYQNRTMSFDDLIHRLSSSLQADGGDDLQAILAARFKVALIDEFQDTDSAQWHIFSTLFGGGSHYLYLIGDPKQAIYKFRGADIFSYFNARIMADYQLTLDKNYRSCPSLVREVNHLFSSRPKPFGFSEEMLGYHAVEPAKKEAEGNLHHNGEALAAMVYCSLPQNPDGSDGRWSSTHAAEMFLSFTVREVCRLLDIDSPVMYTGLEKQQEVTRPVQPRDIAILVRSNRQAEDYLQVFSGAGIPAVVTSRQSVFKTEECRELFMLLQSLASPGDMLLLKTAMTISWFGFTGNELALIWQDEKSFDEWNGRFLAYHQLWPAQGILTMMNRLVEQENVLETLAGQKMAERRIANIQHLLELIQDAETTENFGVSQTLQWLRDMMNEAAGAGDVELRLESDTEAIRIVTMHGSKGLEYPIIFCPFLWQRSNRLRSEASLITCHDSENNLVIDLGSPEFAARKDRALEEELAEDLRLLYVALTRAGLRCYTMWADVKASAHVANSFSSALGYLLFPEGETDYEGQEAVLQSLGQNPSVETLLLPTAAVGGVVYNAGKKPAEVLMPLTPSERTLYTNRQMSSYSGLAALSEHEEYELEAVAEQQAADDTPIALTGLPAGANFGNVIHDSLEMSSFAGISLGEDFSDILSQKCSRYGVAAEIGSLQRLLRNIVQTPLWKSGTTGMEGDGFCLGDLADGQVLKEMQFYFHLDQLATGEINTVLAGEPTVSPLSHKAMQGYLTGFVDLFCEYRGKYYILDYKTNYLGDTLGDYCPANLTRAMEAHNYGLQYWIYTLVVHRHLLNALPGYSYEDHFGGVMYLFVRGMAPTIPGSGVYTAVPDKMVLDRLAECMGGGR